MFLTLPRVGENHQHPSVVGMVMGRPIAFPESATTLPSDKPYVDWIVSPLGLTAHDNTLWVLDEGKRSGIDGIRDGAAKIVGIDIDSRKIVKEIVFHRPFFRGTIQLSDLRFDSRHGKGDTFYISNNGYAEPDSSLIVVAVATGLMRGVFRNQPETSAAPGFTTYVEGVPHAYSLASHHPARENQRHRVVTGRQHALLDHPINPNYYSIPTDVLSNFSIPEDDSL